MSTEAKSSANRLTRVAAAVLAALVATLGFAALALAANAGHKMATSRKTHASTSPRTVRCTTTHRSAKTHVKSASTCEHKPAVKKHASAPLLSAPSNGDAPTASTVFSEPLVEQPQVSLVTVTSITPAQGPIAGGTQVVVKGSGFVSGAAVWIGAKATNVEIVSETELKAKTSEGYGKDEVVVSDAKGASSGGPSFTYIAPPKVTSISPLEGSTAGGTAVKIKGSGFLKGSTVTIGKAATSVTIVSETEITAKTGAGSAGEDEVVVTDEIASSTENPKFTYVTPATVEKVEPATGSTNGGTEVVIKGKGFAEGSTVTIGSKATSVEFVSEEEMKAKTAATAAGKDEVVVCFSDGVCSTGGPSFTYVAPPSVTSVTPSVGSTAGGTAVVVKGKGFVKGSKVKIGPEATSVEIVSETEAKAKTAATAAGKDEVVVEDEYGKSTSGPSFTYVTPAAVEAIEPESGPTAGGTAVVIKGKDFAKAATVTIGNKATNVEVVSEEEIKAKTAATVASEKEVIVENVAGVPSTGGPKFTYIAPPTVTSITPGTGSTLGSTVVVIKGTGFVKGATVKIGSEATNVEIVSETELKAKTAATAAGKDEVVVEDAKGKSSSGPSFTYVAPPKATSISPLEGSTAGGTAVKIKGSGFLKGSTVTIGKAATSVTIVSETEITAKTAAGSAGEDEVVVEDEYGKSTSGPKFTYVTPATVEKVEPATGSTNGGTEVVIKGKGFAEGSTVTIGSKATSVEFVSEEEMKAKTAATAAGKDEVVVCFSDGVCSTGGPSFTYVAPPSVSSVTPSVGSTAGATAVVVKGKGFVKGSKVKIGSEATNVEIVSETEAKAKTAATAAGKDEVVVEDEYGKSTSGPSFTYVTPAAVEAVEPESGSTAGGTAVVIKGKDFVKGATVTIGKAATSVEFVSEEELKAKTAADSAGEDEVIVENASGVPSSSGPKYTFIAPPTVTSITPGTGSTLGGTAVVVKGTGFVKGATVKIGSEATNVEIVSETELKAKTAATAAGKDEVVVEDSKGKSGSAPSFTYVAPPKATSISPLEGSTAGGTAVKIKGSGFLKGSTVTIGKAATSVTIVSETEITAKTAAGSAGEDEVVVEDEYGKSTSGPKFTYVTPATVEKVEPATGSTNGGTEVVIKGKGFAEGSTVTIGSKATSVEFVSEEEMKAKTAATAAGKDEVVVCFSDGVCSTGGPSFTYVAPPSVTSVTPSVGSTAGATAVVVKGKGFVKGSKVKIGSEATSVEIVSETEAKAKTAATAAGKDEVVVEDEYGKSTSGPSFTYVTPATVEAVEPESGSTAGGTAVVIKGKDFVKGATVTIGKAATSVEFVSEEELKAKTAADSAGEDEVIVENAAGVPSSSGPKYTFIAPPTVSSVTPSEGTTTGDTAVVIKGTGFVKGATVKIGSNATNVEVVSETELKAKTAATAAGKDEVVVEDAKGKSSSGPSFTYVAPPKVTSISPLEGSTAGGTAVKIKGSGFLKGSTVAIGKAATSVTVVSETEITAKTAAGSAGEDEVVVTDEIASSTENPKFTYVTPATVEKVEPATGSTNGGTEVVIKGKGFAEGSTVTIGSKATSVEFVSEEEMKAKTAATAAGKDEVVVCFSDGVCSTGGPSFTYVAPPTVSSVTPSVGSTAGATAVVVKGKGFVKGSKVKIGSEATNVEIVSETEAKAKTAATAAGKDEVVVEDEYGKSTSGPSFTYVTPATVEKIEPSSGSTAGGTAVVIKGKDFVKGATVTIGKAATNVEFVSEEELKAKTAADSAGEDEVIVENASGVPSSSGPKYTFIAPPTVSSVSPSEGATAGGNAVVIKGTGFVKGAKVKIGSEATNVEVVSETEIKAETTATAAGKDEVVVEDAKGKSTGGPSFTYVAPPKVTSITPAEGPATGGTAVKIKGTGFLKGSSVTIGKAARSVTIVSETEITATTPAFSAGETEVVVEDEFGASSEGPSFKFT